MFEFTGEMLFTCWKSFRAKRGLEPWVGEDSRDREGNVRALYTESTVQAQ